MNKKMFVLLLLFSGISLHGSAQTWDEFFKQKKTQKKYLLAQIAALNVYTGYLKKGYEIAESGLGLFGAITGDEQVLHKTFFASLKTVNPMVANSISAVELLGWQAGIMRNMNSVRKVTNLKPAEREYTEKVRTDLLRACDQELEDYLLLISTSKLDLSDGERLDRLQKTYLSIADKFRFSKSFANEVALLSQQRQHGQSELQGTAALYGIPLNTNDYETQ
ncbi:hypothetical protein ADIARSV_0500 [Arcticibacter svalbardensis MN12-7]|uniref:TerB family tellurite resistance protein n=1 Tax=Arcticibacter svalbardensis MN12-7 TaxID=1150600 RepID=R9GXP1_9SPHI|nr:hypothetical protein [Arcticibacter svalbardensis]EOR96265.1 hypothetical protein ADIARSV_0500 [Arcticibacter svalbardensis MN12-7]